MKKVIICCIPFKPEIDKVIYKGMDETMPAAEREVRFPVNALLDAKINKDDEVKVIVLVKKDKKNFYERNKQRFLDELLQVKRHYKLMFKWKAYIQILQRLKWSIVLYWMNW